MCSKKVYKFIAWAKYCSSNHAHKYVRDLNVGRDTQEQLDRLLLLRSLIKTLESFTGIKRKTYKGCDVETICVKTCLNQKEICIIANKIKTICKTC